jgi:uncharacterized membrane protein YobD (UPF0266 family)
MTPIPPADDLLVWDAPVRPFKKRDRVYYQTIIALAFLLVVISFFLHEWLLIGSILAVVFVSYVLAAVPPLVISNKLTKKGVWTGETFFNYSEISQYWFENQLESTVMILLLKNSARVFLVVPDEKKEKANEIMNNNVVFREKPLKNAISKIGDWMKRKIPLEESTSSK